MRINLFKSQYILLTTLLFWAFTQAAYSQSLQLNFNFGTVTETGGTPSSSTVTGCVYVSFGSYISGAGPNYYFNTSDGGQVTGQLPQLNPGTNCFTGKYSQGTVNGSFSGSDRIEYVGVSGQPPTYLNIQAYGTSVVGVQGYVDPKFMVVGVTYAPPGPSSSTFVQYQNSSFFGVTNSISKSFQSQTTNSVSITNSGGLPFVANGKVTNTYSTTASQTTKSTSTVTTSFTTQQGEKTAGTGSYFTPVNNDYDIIYVWLNPAAIFTVYTGNPVPTWNGYGVDTTDQAGLDIVGIQLGYLNGHFGAIPPDIQTSFNRSWASKQVFASGQTAALTSVDYAAIASTDPFSVSTYGNAYVGYAPPAGSTSDGRFSLSACSSESSFPYLQAAPSTTAGIYSCTLTYVNLSTQALDITSSYSRTFSTDVSFSGTSFLAAFSADLKTSSTLTWTTEAQSSITTSNTSTAALSVQGPPCGNSIQGVGPCNPVYDFAGNEPTQYDVYQDNLYGTFMFAPIHYY